MQKNIPQNQRLSSPLRKRHTEPAQSQLGSSCGHPARLKPGETLRYPATRNHRPDLPIPGSAPRPGASPPAGAPGAGRPWRGRRWCRTATGGRAPPGSPTRRRPGRPDRPHPHRYRLRSRIDLIVPAVVIFGIVLVIIVGSTVGIIALDPDSQSISYSKIKQCQDLHLLKILTLLLKMRGAFTATASSTVLLFPPQPGAIVQTALPVFVLSAFAPQTYF